MKKQIQKVSALELEQVEGGNVSLVLGGGRLVSWLAT